MNLHSRIMMTPITACTTTIKNKILKETEIPIIAEL